MPNYLSSNGTPADNVGVTGDFSLDYGNKFLWGPKPSDTAWAGSAKSIVGPTGPINSAGLAPQVLGVGYGPGAYMSPGVAVSATPVTLYAAGGSSTISTYVAGTGNFFVGGLLTASTGTVVFELWNQTAGTSLYKSASYAAGANGNSGAVGQFANTVYPMTAGHTYVWRVTGSGTFSGSVIPQYYMSLPVPAPPGVLTTYPTFQFSGSINSTTPSIMNGPGNVPQLYYSNNRASSIYTATVTASAGSTGIAMFYLYNLSTSATAFDVKDITGAIAQVGPGQTLTTQVANTPITAGHFLQARVYSNAAGGSGSYTMSVQFVQ